MVETNFLVTSSGRRGELVQILGQVADLLGGGRVYAADRSQLTSAGWLADALDEVPPISDPTYVDALIEICTRRGITHVIPTIDPELEVLAAAKTRFAGVGANVWVSSVKAVQIAQDKRLTQRWLQDQELPGVQQYDLADLTDEWLAAGPRVAKPSRGSSSIGQAIVTTPSDLGELDLSLDYVVEERAMGLEYTVDVLVDASGRCRCAVPRARLETRAGEVSKGRTTKNVDLQQIAERVVESLPGAYGILNVQMFLEPSGQIKVIEINARFGGGFPLTWASGALLPLWLAEESAGQAPTASLDWQSDKVMLRYDAAVYLDMPYDVQ